LKYVTPSAWQIIQSLIKENLKYQWIGKTRQQRGIKMKKSLLLISLMIGLLFLFSSMEVVLANITVDYTPVIVVGALIMAFLVFFLALIGWLAMRRLHQQKKV